MLEFLFQWVLLCMAVLNNMTVQPMKRLLDTNQKQDEKDVSETGKVNLRRGVEVQLKSTGRRVKSDVIRIDSVGNRAELVFVFIPGNPGLIDFYIRMLEAIHEKHDGRISVVGIGHAGHSSHSHGKVFKPISYQEQIEHKIRTFELEFPHIHKDPNVKVVIAGHSVGSRIGLEMIHHMPYIKVEHYFGLCPTVMHIAQSPNGKKMTPFLAKPMVHNAAFAVVHVLAMVLAVLPQSWSHSVVKSVMKRDCATIHDDFVQHGAALVDPYTVRNALFMAHEEMNQICDADKFQHLIDKYHARLNFIVSPVDKWCCSNIIGQMRQAFEPCTFKVLSDQCPHAFCLSEDATNEIVDAIMEIMDEK